MMRLKMRLMLSIASIFALSACGGSDTATTAGETTSSTREDTTSADGSPSETTAADEDLLDPASFDFCGAVTTAEMTPLFGTEPAAPVESAPGPGGIPQPLNPEEHYVCYYALPELRVGDDMSNITMYPGVSLGAVAQGTPLTASQKEATGNSNAVCTALSPQVRGLEVFGSHCVEELEDPNQAAAPVPYDTVQLSALLRGHAVFCAVAREGSQAQAGPDDAVAFCEKVLAEAAAA